MEKIFLALIFTMVAAGATYAGGSAIGELKASALTAPADQQVTVPGAAEPAPAAPAKMDARSALQKQGCLACHRYKGEGGTYACALEGKLKRHNKNWVKAKLLKPPVPEMPAFTGTAQELDEFVDAIQQ